MKSRFLLSTILLASFSVVTSGVWAQEGPAPFKFFKPSATAPDAAKKADVKTSKTETVEKTETTDSNSVEIRPITAVVGYPKVKLGVAYNPGFIGLKQTLKTTGAVINVSGFVFSDIAVGASVDISPRLGFGLDIHYSPIASGLVDLNEFRILPSSLALIPVSAYAKYCLFFNDYRSKFCPGLTVGIDSFPLLTLANNTDYQLKKVNDMVVGARALLEQPLLLSLTGKLYGGFDYGLGQGQIEDISSGLSYKAWGGGEIEMPLYRGLFAGIGGYVEDRVLNYKKSTDSFEATGLGYAGYLALRWDFSVPN